MNNVLYIKPIQFSSCDGEKNWNNIYSYKFILSIQSIIMPRNNPNKTIFSLKDLAYESSES